MERLELELSVIEKMGFAAYFLIVWDFVRFAKDSGIAVGPGRGSAAGSIVSYSLRITDVDPIEYDLLFERFLNAERISMPDIDIDFSVKGRERVIQYVAGKYGRESVAQIVTFGRMLPRAATRDAARVLGFDYGTGDRLAKLIPEPVMGRSKTFDEYLKEEPELRRVYDTEPEARQVIETAKGLEGIVRNSSIHAAAVVIADRPLTDIVPLQLAEDRGGGRERRRRALVPDRHPVLDEADRGDRAAEDGLPRPAQPRRDRGGARHRRGVVRRSGPTSPACRSTTRAPTRCSSAATRWACSSSSRTGCATPCARSSPRSSTTWSRSWPSTARAPCATSTPTRATSATPTRCTTRTSGCAPITESSYGVILYQEQSMQIAKAIAGFSGPEADDLRKAIGKKQRERMAALRDRFFEGARGTGTAEAVINELWSVNEAAADYSFNRSHAACYALISYRTAWLKANYPAEYMAALISSVMSTKDKVPFFVAQCEDMGIEVLPPDVNQSGHDFKVVEGNIRFGLDAVKNVGSAGRRGDPGRPRGGRPVRVGVGLLPPGGLPCGQQEGGRVARQVRRARLAAGHAHRHGARARAGAGRGPAGAAGRTRRAGVVLRHERLGPRRAGAPRPARARRCPTSART